MAETIEVSGHVALGYEAVKDAFAKNLADGLDVGASFAVMRGSDVLVDLHGGIADMADGRLWDSDTLVNVFSTTKGPTALSVAILVDRGLLSYDDTVAKHWPDFAANGKEAITVGQLLSHQGGVCGLRQPITVEKYYDWNYMCRELAAMKPFWTPGDGSGYHAVTYGFLAGELVRRVDGRTPGTFIAEEISAKVDADFHVGLPASEDARVAPLIKSPTAAPLTGDTPADYTIAALGNPVLKPREANTREWRAAEIPAANGHGTARGLARIYAPLAHGGELDGVRLIGSDALRKATAEQCCGVDRNLSIDTRWGAGFLLNNDDAYGPNDTTFGHSGWGGSMAFADPVAGISVAYTMNQMGSNLRGDPRTLGLVGAVYASL
jgi:CubicO group peptidase (beta-lactamase class C family)